MKKQFKLLKQISIVAIFALAFSACKKDEDNTPKPTTQPTKTDILAGSDWVMKAMVVDGVDYMQHMEDCEKDNIMQFKATGIYVDDEGSLKCDSKDKQTRKGVWEFIENETKLLVDNEDTLNIDLLKPDSLLVSITFNDDGTDKTLKTTFVAK